MGMDRRKVKTGASKRDDVWFLIEFLTSFRAFFFMDVEIFRFIFKSFYLQFHSIEFNCLASKFGEWHQILFDML